MKFKKEIRDKENMERLASTIETLESFKENKDLPRVIRNQIRDIYDILREEKNGSISVRAANAVSMLDSLTQNRHMESHIRTTLWHVVSKLESIREWFVIIISSTILSIQRYSNYRCMIMDISKFFDLKSLKKNFDKKHTKLLIYAGISMILIGIAFILTISLFIWNHFPGINLDYS